MQLNKKNLDRLLQLNDDQLRGVILKLASSRGIDASTLKLGTQEIGMIRAALAGIREEDLPGIVDALAERLTAPQNRSGSDRGDVRRE